MNRFRKIPFFGVISFVFLLSMVGLTVAVTTNLKLQESYTSSAYTAGSTNVVDMGHYVSKFGFYNPGTTYSINSTVFSRLKAMMPAAFLGADKFNARFGESVEPELIVWWTYAEGVGGRVTFSNCHDAVYSITNCSTPGNWQLGYGIQFSAVQGLLVNAFTDTHGDPNNSQLVQTVGQNVLNIDKSNGVSCGCSFPAKTASQIAGGISYSYAASDNWWASVLSRDPAINSYINAEALRVSRFNRQLAWGWGSYYRNNWQLYSNYLATILNNWISLGGCTAYTNCFIAQAPLKPTATSAPAYFMPVGIVANNSTPTSKPMPKPTSTPTLAPTSTPTPTMTPTPTSVKQGDFSQNTSNPTSTASKKTEVIILVSPSPTPEISPTENVSPTLEPTQSAVSLAGTSITPASQPSSSPQISLAPIAEIPSQNGVIPQSNPNQAQYIASAHFSQTVGLVSMFGLILSVLLFVPITRNKIFHFFKSVFWKKTKDDKPQDNKDVDKVYYVKVISGTSEKNLTHVSLTDNNKTIDGFFNGNIDKDGFYNIKGELKEENGLHFVEISSLEQFEDAENTHESANV